jgi:uncharacterized protein (DUF697 family)
MNYNPWGTWKGKQVPSKTEPLKSEEAAQAQEPMAEETVDATGPDSQAMAEAKLEQAAEIVRRKMLWSAGVGLVPVPLVDGAAFLGLQLHMMKQLCDLYGVPFKVHWVKNTVAGLLGSVLPAGLGGTLAYGLRFIPVIGITTSALAFSGLGGAATYALGKVFTNHLAEGGTVLDFSADKLKTSFKKHFKDGQEVVAEAKGAEPAAA